MESKRENMTPQEIAQAFAKSEKERIETQTEQKENQLWKK